MWGRGWFQKSPPPPKKKKKIWREKGTSYIGSKQISCHIPLLINKKCTPFPYSNGTFLALWEGRERAFMLKALNVCKTIRYTAYTCMFTKKKEYLLFLFLYSAQGNTKGRGPPLLFYCRARMRPRNFLLRLKLPAPATQVIGEQAADAAP